MIPFPCVVASPLGGAAPAAPALLGAHQRGEHSKLQTKKTKSWNLAFCCPSPAELVDLPPVPVEPSSHPQLSSEGVSRSLVWVWTGKPGQCSAGARRLKLGRGVCTRKGWKRTVPGRERPGQSRICARRVGTDVAEIHLGWHCHVGKVLNPSNTGVGGA